MKREIIKLDFFEEEELDMFACGEDSENFEFIEEDTTYYDTEKGYIDNTVIIKRLSDGKFFSGSYSNWGQGNIDWDGDFEEVFPEVTRTTIYK